MNTAELIAGLPGEALMRKAIADSAAGRTSAAAYLAHIARTRLTVTRRPRWYEVTQRR
jgi:hypothetical protein